MSHGTKGDAHRGTKGREGCVPMVRIAFRRPPQSHVTSLPDFHRKPERRRPRSTEAGTRPSGGHSPRQQGRGTRREPHGLRRGRTGAQNAQTGATPGPRKRQRARAQRDGQIACRHATHPAAALQVAVLEAGGEGRAGQLAPALLPASAHTTHRRGGAEGLGRQRTRRRARAGAPRKPKERRGASTGGPFARTPRLTRATPCGGR